MNDATHTMTFANARRAAAGAVLILVALAAGAPCFLPRAAAQSADATSLTITPPFFTLNASPGDAWASSIRVVNTNAAPLPVVATVMGFAPSDQEGHGTFKNLSEIAGDPDALANWITLGSSTAVVPPGSAADVPFSINIPKDASPGGHYAGILIGTQSPEGSPASGSHIGISSFISALIFVTVSGDIKESGNIQEFSTDKGFYQRPDVNFNLVFANTGNVHVRPVGEIQIYNAFGKEEGTVPVNQEETFGYVLPSSSRKFSEEWQGPGNLWDIGRFTAIVTLAYGVDGTKSVSQTLTFWVLPLGMLAEDGVIALLVIGGFVILLRRYVKKMLEREMGRYGSSGPSAPHEPPRPQVPRSDPKGTVDLRKK